MYRMFSFFGAAVIPSFLLTLIITPLVLKIAHRNNWYDEQDHRKIHETDTPRLGGVAFFVSITVIWSAFVILRTLFKDQFTIVNLLGYLPFLAGAALIFLVGLLDDFTTLRARYKLLGQIAAALVLSAGGYHFTALRFPLIDLVIPLGDIGGPFFSILWIVGITNAVNLIDGLDGLSGGVSAIVSLTLGIAAVALGNLTGAFMAFSLFGAIVGFLRFNFPPARIFMGDSGSLFLGYCLSVLPILTIRGASAPFAFAFGATLLILPILDTLAAIVRRIRKRVPLHYPDMEHLHHKLLSFGFSTKQILAVAYGITALASFGALAWFFLEGHLDTSSSSRLLTTLSSVFMGAVWLLAVLLFTIVDRVQKKRTGERYYKQ